MKTLITVFGATGNLMYAKLLPAFSALFKQGHLGKDTTILCVARRQWTIDDYIYEAQKEASNDVDFEMLSPQLEFHSMDISNPKEYQDLYTHIENIDADNKIFYLAVPPTLFPKIARGVSESGCIKKNDASSRIVFEKPFGDDLNSAKAINQLLWDYFDESQIYRIDHYLGKEMIQNILTIRFTNKLFTRAWDHHTIASVTIIAKEDIGVLNRANFYDSVGALKDMVQSHLMQMAALIAMEEPNDFEADDIRAQKVKVFKAMTIDKNDIVMGQYANYHQEKNVNADSKTETFVYLKATIDTPRWKEVPFYFLTGKKLDEKRSEIIIDFKPEPLAKQLWPHDDIPHNQLIIRVAPEQGVHLKINVKKAGLNTDITKAALDYCHDCTYLGNVPEAYEKLMLDVIQNKPTLFTRWDEIETTWHLIDQIKTYQLEPIIYEHMDDIKSKIKSYPWEDTHDL